MNKTENNKMNGRFEECSLNGMETFGYLNKLKNNADKRDNIKLINGRREDTDEQSMKKVDVSVKNGDSGITNGVTVIQKNGFMRVKSPQIAAKRFSCAMDFRNVEMNGKLKRPEIPGKFSIGGTSQLKAPKKCYFCDEEGTIQVNMSLLSYLQ